MVPLIEEIEALRYKPDLPDWVSELFGPELYTAVGRIYGGLPPGGPSMIPDECTIRVDSRPQPGVEIDEVRRLIEGAVERAQERDPEARYDIVLADEEVAHLIERDHPSDRRPGGGDPVGRREALPRTVAAPGSPIRQVSGTWFPTVIFGPGREPVYMPNEWLAIEDIEIAAQVYAATAAILLAPDE